MDNIKIKIDKVMWALESRANRDFDEFYLDRETGNVLSADRLASADPALFKEVERNSARYTLVRPLQSHDIEAIIDDFLQMLDAFDVKDYLQEVMLQEGNLGTFKEVISEFPQVEEKWKSFFKTELKNTALTWLREHKVECSTE